jgi:hypothetical protein
MGTDLEGSISDIILRIIPKIAWMSRGKYETRWLGQWISGQTTELGTSPLRTGTLTTRLRLSKTIETKQKLRS